jgi:hypothetical protein
MAREKDGYRENLELLNERFPDKLMLSIKEAMQVMGYSDARTIKKYLGKCIVDGRISKVFLARHMCGGS